MAKPMFAVMGQRVNRSAVTKKSVSRRREGDDAMAGVGRHFVAARLFSGDGHAVLFHSGPEVVFEPDAELLGNDGGGRVTGPAGFDGSLGVGRAKVVIGNAGGDGGGQLLWGRFGRGGGRPGGGRAPVGRRHRRGGRRVRRNGVFGRLGDFVGAGRGSAGHRYAALLQQGPDFIEQISAQFGGVPGDGQPGPALFDDPLGIGDLEPADGQPA